MNFNKLPENVLLYLSFFLTPGDLVAFIQLSKYFAHLDSDPAWHHQLSRHFLMGDFKPTLDNREHPKKIFGKLYRRYYLNTDHHTRKTITWVKDNNFEKITEEKTHFPSLATQDIRHDIYFWASKNKSQQMLDHFYFNHDLNHFSIEKKLILAVQCNQVSIITEFLKTVDGKTQKILEDLLYYAAYYGHDEIVSRLLKTMPTPNLTTNSFIINRDTSLHIAVKHGHVTIVRQLILSGAEINLLSTCYHSKNFNFGAQVGLSPLHLAAKYDQIEITNILLAAGADINILGSGNQTPLHVAILYKNFAVANILIGAKANLAIQSEGIFFIPFSPFHLAVYMGAYAITKVILKTNPHLINVYNVANFGHNDFFESALHIAVRKNFVEMVRLLIEAKANLNAHDHAGNTALHLAAKHGYIEIGKLLIAAGANVNVARPWDAATPLHLAVIYARYGSDHGANFHLTINDGQRVAAVADLEDSKQMNAPPNNKNQLNFIHLLLNNNKAYVDPIMHPNGPNNDSFQKVTPLHVAILNNAVLALRALLSHDANPNLPLYIKGEQYPLLSKWIRSQNIKLDLYIAARKNKRYHVSFFGNRPYEEKVAAATALRDAFESNHTVTNLLIQHPILKKGQLKKLFDQCVEIDKVYEATSIAKNTR